MLRERPREGWVPRVTRALTEIAPQSGGTALAMPLVDGTRVRDLSRYLDLVVTWNQRYDLTAARGWDELVDLFVADAAVLAAVYGGGPAREPPAHWVDVGSGAGAPGLPLSILCPDWVFSLVEPRARRVAFLRTCVGALNLRDVSVVRSRVEQLGPQQFDVAVSRATLPPGEWLAAGARIARSVWLMLAQAEPPELPGWQADLDVEYGWPLTGAARRLMRFVRTT